ncbi:hypothetical protein AAFF_G00276010 [Aldrovandia affinis]|uniref:Uncharacterized protein n=1 Tax=Aldrovandia affinis TaxID=143900 RepID=A0AAD7RB39_9TELE|nr:hypothetical protein AAFF_G00276010 [Aldrovandia affinis]
MQLTGRGGWSTKPAVSTAKILYVDWPAGSSMVLLKMSRVILRSGTRSLNTYALLDGSQRTILLHEAAQQLGLQGSKTWPLGGYAKTSVIHRATVSFSVAPATQPDQPFNIH